MSKGSLGFTLSCILLVCVGGCGFFGSAVDVAKQEFDPHELLRKYTWFKDAAAQLDKKQADIKVYENRFKDLKDAYVGKARSEWARDDREQYNIWSAEVAGIRASYNGLASEFNANMSKENWRFCEVGRLPPGVTVPLPREYKPYEEK